MIAADLFIPNAWTDPANGNVRTDMWGIMSDGTPTVTAYPIIGFTNYGGSPRLRVFDGEISGGWVDLSNTVNTDAWTSLSIELTATSFVYRVDGSVVYTDSTINGTTAFSAAIMQAYNFGDPSISGTILAPYTAHWDNAVVVPEPSTYVAGALLLLPFGLGAVRKFQNRRKA